MTTNLIFKRQITVDGVVKTVTRIVPVSIPTIKSGDGWVLSGHADDVEVCEGVYVHYPQKIESTIDSDQVKEQDIKNFESNVRGTAKLVRIKGTIKIVARRGKTTYNQTTPNSVCIDDFTKNNFFKHCREVFGDSSGIFEFSESKTLKPYLFWSNYIDEQYQKQKCEYIKEKK